MNLLTSYVLLGFRALRKDTVASLINLVGLSVAVACAVALFLLLREINLVDDFHENADRIVLVGHEVTEGAERGLWGTAPEALGPTLAAEVPQVERAVRVSKQAVTVRTERDTFLETLTVADAGFFDVFSFPLRTGRSALSEPGTVVLSAAMAAKYFGTDDPVGQTLSVTATTRSSADEAAPSDARTLTVTGVAAPFPARADFRFDLLASRPAQGGATSGDWGSLVEATFLLLNSPADAGTVSEQLRRYVPLQNAASPDRPAAAFFLDSMGSPDWWTAWQIEDRALQPPLLWESVTFGGIALLVLLVACINYVTISLGGAARRLREIGVRKALGASRRELILQFLAENLVVCSLAVVAGLVVAWAVTVPFLNGLIHRPHPLDLRDAVAFWPVVAALPLFLGLVAGLYPAVYVSGFQPTVILRDRVRLAEKKGLTRTLTTVQFTLALVTICLSLFTSTLDDKLLGGDWGYNPDDLLVLAAASTEQAAWVERQASQSRFVRGMAGAADAIGTAGDPVPIRVGGTEQQAFHFRVGPEYLATLGIETVAGRTFDDAYAGDPGQSVVVNRTFVEEQAWNTPVGETLELDGRTVSVIGVVDDVLLAPMVGTAQPVVFGLASPAEIRSVTLRAEDGAAGALEASLRDDWAEAFPGVDFVSYAQTDVFLRESMGGVSRFMSYLAGFALLISCMGLFGLAAQGAARRMKEVGVRKVLGASALQLVLLVNRSFLGMLGLATLIATPLCFFGLRTVLRLAPVDIALGSAPFVLANALVFGLAAATLALQTYQLVHVQPAEVLRDQ